MLNLLRSGFLAGVCIGIAGTGYLLNKNIIGAVLFSFGLLTVVHYQLKLFTGTAGFVDRKTIHTLPIILIANILGCLGVALIARFSGISLQETATVVLEKRLQMGAIGGLALSIPCGFIMTTAVNFARKDKFLPLLFGVPLFIMCGFPHCIADAFYYLCVPLEYLLEHSGETLLFYLAIVAGNFIGCNLYRAIAPRTE